MKIKNIIALQHDDVYNITVENTHNYVDGGGIISKNCDALRYFISGRPVPNKKQAQQKHEFFNNTKKDFAEKGKINII